MDYIELSRLKALVVISTKLVYASDGWLRIVQKLKCLFSSFHRFNSTECHCLNDVPAEKMKESIPAWEHNANASVPPYFNDDRESLILSPNKAIMVKKHEETGYERKVGHATNKY
ncbi:hypothetical protein D918_02788 [Trichuris suis]|nr:hypothetical protein D918_02788 [Trichuris suis]